jgi:hypothetical protein
VSTTEIGSREESLPEVAEPSPPEPAEAADDLRTLDASLLHVRRNGNRLEIRREGEDDWQQVKLVRLFPFTEPERWISIVDKDNKEIGILPDLKGFSAEDLRVLRDELRLRYLVPEIIHILSIRDRVAMMAEWTVETDRGKAKFLMRNLRDKLQEPLPGYLSLTDMEGNRFDIPDVAALDRRSRRLLEERL